MKTKKTVFSTVMCVALVVYLGVMVYSFVKVNHTLSEIDSNYVPVNVSNVAAQSSDENSDLFIEDPVMNIHLDKEPLASGQMCLRAGEDSFVVIDTGDNKVAVEYSNNESVMKIGTDIVIRTADVSGMANGVARLKTDTGYATVMTYCFSDGVGVSAMASSDSEEKSHEHEELLQFVYEHLTRASKKQKVMLEGTCVDSDVVLSASGVQLSKGEDVIYISTLKSGLEGTGMNATYTLPTGESVSYSTGISDANTGYIPFVLKKDTPYKILAKSTDQLDVFFSDSKEAV